MTRQSTLHLSLLSLFLLGALATSCEGKKKPPEATATPTQGAASSESTPTKDELPLVVTTTTMLASAAKQIGGDAINVQSIMRAGGDPHLHQPTPSDAKLVKESQLVITSGLYLEGWLDGLVRNAGGDRPVVVSSDGIDPIKMEGSPGGVDPHFWFDLTAWQRASTNVTNAIAKLTPEKAAEVKARGEAYQKRLKALDVWTRAQLGTIPKESRYLITSHDAFNYFGRSYDIGVIAIQGVSTEQEASQRDVVNTIELVKKHNVPAVFVESSVNPKLIKQVARETGVKVVGPLFSDSTSKEGVAVTFVGMFSENVRLMVESLGGKYEPFKT